MMSSLFVHPKNRDGQKTLLPSELVRIGVQELIKSQEADGQWPYEGYVGTPIGFRVGSTSIVAEALLFAASNDKDAQEAVQRALTYVLEHVAHAEMTTSTENTYDVRIWGQMYALEFLCQARARKIAGEHQRQVEAAIPRLVKTLVQEEIPSGGWNYAHRNASMAFATAVATQALLLARSQGEKVPDEILDHCRKVLETSRVKSSIFTYMGPAKGNEDEPSSSLPGSACRALICETTLLLLGSSSLPAVQSTLDNFFANWEEIRKHRNRPGTHVMPYGIALYYFFFGHRYAAQAIQMLPEKHRDKERARLLEAIVKTRDVDGTWNDRTFSLGRNYGTAAIVLTLLDNQAFMIPKFVKK